MNLDHLPYGSAVVDGRRVALVRVSASSAAMLDGELFADGSLDRLLAAGPAAWTDTRASVRAALEGDELRVLALSSAELVLPFTVADYVEFYAS